jgi:hypothetical protein
MINFGDGSMVPFLVDRDIFWRWIYGALPGGEKYYMLGLFAICWAIWKCQNSICFEKKVIKNPNVILFSVCSFMRHWAGLHSDEEQEMVKSGVDLLVKTAVKILGRRKDGRSTLVLTDIVFKASLGRRSGDA